MKATLQKLKKKENTYTHMYRPKKNMLQTLFVGKLLFEVLVAEKDFTRMRRIFSDNHLNFVVRIRKEIPLSVDV